MRKYLINAVLKIFSLTEWAGRGSILIKPRCWRENGPPVQAQVEQTYLWSLKVVLVCVSCCQVLFHPHPAKIFQALPGFVTTRMLSCSESVQWGNWDSERLWLALKLTNSSKSCFCQLLGNMLNFSQSQFPHLHSGDGHSTSRVIKMKWDQAHTALNTLKSVPGVQCTRTTSSSTSPSSNSSNG